MEPDATRLQLLMDLRRWREAEEYCRECISREPERGHWHTQYAIIAMQDRRRLKEALRAAEVGISKDVQDAYSHLIRGLVLVRLTRYTPALQALDESMRLNHHYPTAYALKATILSERGKHAKAVKVVHQGLTIDPGNAELLAKRAWLEMQLARFTDARRSAEAALAESPNDAGHLNILGCVLMTEAHGSLRPFAKLMRFREAEQYFREALRNDPTERAAQENRYQNSHDARIYAVRLGFYIAMAAIIVAVCASEFLFEQDVWRAIKRILCPLFGICLITLFLSSIIFAIPELAMALPLAWLGFPRVPKLTAERALKAAEQVGHYDFDPDPPQKPAKPWWKSNAALIGGLILGFTAILAIMLRSVR